MNKVKSLDFSGETIYCGLDVHKKNWSVHALINGKQVAAFSQNPDPELLKKHFEKNFPKATLKVAYEAGFSGFGFQRSFAMIGVDCAVVNPADIPASDKDKKRKNDKRDARKLAIELSNGNLQGIYIPDNWMEHMRCLVRGRNAKVKSQTRCINQIKHLLHSQGIKEAKDIRKISLKLIAKLQAMDLGSPMLNTTLKLYIEDYLATRKVVADFTIAIRQFSREMPLADMQKSIQSVPGVGMLSAMVLQTEIGDIKRFKSMDQLNGYAGLVPDLNSSGERIGVRGLTHRANQRLRSAIIESSWTAIKHDPAMFKLYNGYCQRMQANKAIIRIAKHLLSRIRYVWINQTIYQKGLMGPIG